MKTHLPRCAQSGLSVLLLAFSLAGSLAGCSLFASGTAPLASPDAGMLATPPVPAVAAGFYRVNPGDTLIGIAKAFDREPSAIGQWNHLSPEGSLLVGQVLRVAPVPVATGLPASNLRKDAHANVAASPSEVLTESARLAWPVSGPVIAPFVAGSNKGIVMGGRAGERIKAASGGRVVYAGGRIATYGQLIIIKHDAHLLTAYGNNRVLLVKEGAVVKRGEAIAEMGADDKGQASVRFEVRADGKPVDPLKYLPKRQ
jgi:lipoprotein NlpD